MREVIFPLIKKTTITAVKAGDPIPEIVPSSILSLSSLEIEKYFSDRGFNVSIHMEEDPVNQTTNLLLKPMMAFRLSIPKEVMEMNDQEYITAILEESVNSLKDSYVRILGMNNTGIFPSDNIDKICIIYNPKKVDKDTLNSIMVALNL